MTPRPATPPGGEQTRILDTVSLLASALAQTAVENWRLARLTVRLCDADRPRVQPITDRLGAWLSQASVVIEEHTGHTYVDGMALEIVATEERANLPAGAVAIVETLKPSVYVAGQLILRGQVVLGRGVAEMREGETDGAGHN